VEGKANCSKGRKKTEGGRETALVGWGLGLPGAKRNPCWKENIVLQISPQSALIGTKWGEKRGGTRRRGDQSTGKRLVRKGVEGGKKKKLKGKADKVAPHLWVL